MPADSDKTGEATVTVTSALASSSVNSFNEFIETGRLYSDKPIEGREWLTSTAFQPFISGTDVSERLLNARHAQYTEKLKEQACSPLSLLSKWLASWYELAKTARSEARKDASTEKQPVPEEAALQWLYKYIDDFLSQSGRDLPGKEIDALASVIFQICRLTGRSIDMLKCVGILYTALGLPAYSNSTAREALGLMCQLRYRDDFSDEIRLNAIACMDLLFESSTTENHQSTMFSTLLELILEADGPKMYNQVNVARGAVQTLRDLILRKQSDMGDVRPSIEQIVECLMEAAEHRIPRLDAEILGFCDDLFSKEGWRDVVRAPPSNLVQLLEELATNIHQGSESTSPSSYIRLNVESIKQLNANVIASLRTVEGPMQMVLYNFLVEHSKLLTPSASMEVLQFVREKRLCSPDATNGTSNARKIARAFLEDIYQTPECRIVAIDVLVAPLKNVDSNLPKSSNLSAFAKYLFELLQRRLQTEPDAKVMDALSTELAGVSTNPILGTQYVESTVSLMVKLAMAEPKGVEHARSRGCLATLGLLNLFVKPQAASPEQPKIVYEAMLKIAGLSCLNTEARLVALRFLLRVRADAAGKIYLESTFPSKYIAVALCRTAESANTVDSSSLSDEKTPPQTSKTHKISRQLWKYPDTEEHNDHAYDDRDCLLAVKGHRSAGPVELDIGLWVETLLECLQRDKDWETYSYIIVHLGAQLSNLDLFTSAMYHVNLLLRNLCDQINDGNIQEPPQATGLRKSDVTICLFNVLTPLIAFNTIYEHNSKTDNDQLVKAFLHGVGGQWEGTSRGCLHSLSICCLEIPASVARNYPTILDKMTKNVTQAHLSVHILEFLAELARLPEEHSHLQESDVRNIFGVCIRVLEIARDKKTSTTTDEPTRHGTPSNRHSGLTSRRLPPYRAEMQEEIGMPQYEYALAYHTMIFWFLSLRLYIRAQHVSWIIKRLTYNNSAGEEVMDEQSLVFREMMQRTAYSDIEESQYTPEFTEEDGPVESASWVMGLSIVTVDTAGKSGRSVITKRQATGTTYSMDYQLTAPRRKHRIPVSTSVRHGPGGASATIAMMPEHLMLRMLGSAAAVKPKYHPVRLPNDDFVKRAISAFDRNPEVDGYKMGSIYVGPGQVDEKEILANTEADTSPDFLRLLEGLGTRVQLSEAEFNTQGLISGEDGDSTYAWGDRIAEIVYHVPALMPTNIQDDPGFSSKKRHIGNDFVNIIFNKSGKPYNFDTIPSQFNYVNIIVEPATRVAQDQAPNEMPRFYTVHVRTQRDFPNISAASDPKVISAQQLPTLVRLLGLNACVFAKAWVNRDSDDEYPSSWRARLREIRKLRERVLERTAAAAKAAAKTDDRRRVDTSTVAQEESSLVESLDFARWTRPPPTT